MLNTVLDPQGKETVFRYLVAIAGADNEFAEEERELLGRIASRLHIGEAQTGAAA